MGNSQMKKPSAFQFFAVEVAIWIAIFGYLITNHSGAPHILFLKISVVNVGLAAFNMIGAIVCAATGWAPFENR